MINNYFINEYCTGDVFQNEIVVFAKNRLISLFQSKKRKQQYKEIYTPAFLKNIIWKKTGHFDFFADNMFFLEKNCALKPMSCPGAALFVKSTFNKTLSRSTFPIKIFEFGRVFRKELTGVGKMMRRLNIFTQDDSHIFCENVESCQNIIASLLDDAIFFYTQILKCTDIKIALSTKPKSSINDSAIWLKASEIMKDIVLQRNIVNVQEEEGAFYGPKIDMMVNDIQLFTCQLDFFLAEKLDVSFCIKEDKIIKSFFPIVVHSATMGSLERFLSIIMEDMTMPFWCVDKAFVIIRIKGETHKSQQLQTFFEENNIEYIVENDINTALKKWKSQHKYFLFCGEAEDTNTINIRTRDTIISQITLDSFRADIKSIIILVRNFFNYDSAL